MHRSLLVIALVACSSPPKGAPPKPAPAPATPVDRDFDALASSVGPVLRGVARVDLEGPNEPAQIAGMIDAIHAFGGKAPKDCHASMSRLRIAIGEPLRIAAEIDGDLDSSRLLCILGDRLFAMMHQADLVVSDRPGGGLSITRASQPGAPNPAILARCAEHDCATIELGPAHRVAFTISFGAKTRFSLVGLDATKLAAAIASTFGASFPVTLHAAGRELSGELARDTDPAWAQSLRERLLEAFKIPSSSMQPTLTVGDNIFVAKGALTGPLVAGDVVVYRFEDRTYVKRIAALGGQTIEETAEGFVVDGVKLPTIVVDPAFKFGEDDPERHQHIEHVGALVRETMGAKSFLTLRTGPPRELKSWTVPQGQVFLLGDNRNNSNDSRYTGTIPVADVIGRVIGIWLAWDGDAPAWNRMAAAIE